MKIGSVQNQNIELSFSMIDALLISINDLPVQFRLQKLAFYP